MGAEALRHTFEKQEKVENSLFRHAQTIPREKIFSRGMVFCFLARGQSVGIAVAEKDSYKR